MNGIRYRFIDRLKGLTMLLVVIAHIIAFSLESIGNPLSLSIGAFHMPLFIFLSGFVVSTPPR